MVPFAGYSMPVQYPSGILAEHTACRAAAAIFDVSHMGQAELRGADAARALEQLTPADVQGLKPGRQRYGLLLTESGGILDDFMVANLGDRLLLVFNASRKAVDEAAVGAVLPPSVRLDPLRDRALLAVQGPGAEAALAPLLPALAALPFMGVLEGELVGFPAVISRSGYTGEDGFEISLPAEGAERLARALVDGAGVTPAGLGARDSLRLEAGLCLYGQDLDETTSPVEAALNWTLGKRRRMAWDFRGADRVRAELDNGPSRLRVGFAVEGRQPVRAGAPVALGAHTVGAVTSGGYAPSLGAPVAMGYVSRPQAADGTALDLLLRGRAVPARVAPTPFVPHRYKRAAANPAAGVSA
ncbi:glycine cleavage system aminomethyltransferase GcvT [Roseomonas sp. BN140053]|uniref:glycine cleavage system aminomethyltransferase GcvT n=1 Tax=Roseomonas sp. BN140053 TaxID=3391898 RepID=UPI0039EC4DC9